ncbi:Stk1 family PASTA domain-containing Ser/Thr kinase [Nocardioides mangrovicus]|uniref:non-specific serine/threonine protein kinase n=2 Tax=Nocardioides mangrovicus TaxID=2478913 RepID=A0A3L8P0G1_9ACTN|nr:Stk1 family PASTA domain-containing Ser/Thr kinase [Nocardioides mangrovicus]RLV48069.1 Stk1 family PASTA domain-containing Ser/Thr kinase [Nocardioides mangrovicus]
MSSNGHQVGGRYELGEMLGRGGMAEVRRGRDVRLGRTVAVKRLRTDLASDPTFQARFRREAQSAASLNHPAIVSVYDTGEEMSGDGTDVAQPYIVMEYVAGRTLRDILREGRKILPERAMEITSGVLGALDYSHRAGIIHRDIKPGNVMLTPTGDVKVMDFGIARAMADAHNTMTQTAAVVGTAQYLSPEQARGEAVDSRSDVYSTGCLLYELLTGRPPFVGESPVAVAYQHVREDAAPPSMHDVELDPQIDAIVMKALAKPLAQRYQSAAAMKADIDRYLAGQPVEAPAPAVPVEAPTTVTSTGSVPITPTAAEESPARKRWPMVLLGLLLLAILVAAAIFGPRLLKQDDGPAQTAVPSLVGLTQAQAELALKQNDLKLGEVTQAASKTVPKGSVISSDPVAGKSLDEGSTVALVVSTGKPAVQLPDVVGQNKDDAQSQLQQLGLEVTLKNVESDEPEGQVTAMDPGAGTSVADGTNVTLSVSEGPQQVPDVVGKTQAQAERLIKAAGFEPSVIENATTEATAGTVIQQSPKGGTTENQGSTITIVVSTYQPPSTPTATPTPTDTPTETPTTPGSTPTTPPTP